MKKKIMLTLFVLQISLTFFSGTSVQAQSVTGGANITLKQEDQQIGIRDPEQLTTVDPGTEAKTEGRLRIDFAPQLTFSTGTISTKDVSYLAYAQLFKNQEGARGNFVQVSDYRDVKSGWTLQIRQENQFQHTQYPEVELSGAIISFDKAWTNSDMDSSVSPTVSKDVIQMSNIGETYNLADASFDKGGGTWSIAFGTSGESGTLTPAEDEKGNQVVDPDYNNQPAFTNEAVKLTIPGSTKKISGNYSTVLTWIIAELP